MMMTMMTMQAYPAALERIQKWEAHFRRKTPEKFLSCPSTFLALQVQSVVLVCASVWSVQFDHFLVFLFFLLLVPPCPVICASVGTCPRVLGGVSVTFVLQFHTKKHDKTAIQSECIASQRLLSIFAFKITNIVILLTRFCKTINQSHHIVWGHVPQVPQWHDGGAEIARPDIARPDNPAPCRA